MMSFSYVTLEFPWVRLDGLERASYFNVNPRLKSWARSNSISSDESEKSLLLQKMHPQLAAHLTENSAELLQMLISSTVVIFQRGRSCLGHWLNEMIISAITSQPNEMTFKISISNFKSIFTQNGGLWGLKSNTIWLYYLSSFFWHMSLVGQCWSA